MGHPTRDVRVRMRARVEYREAHEHRDDERARDGERSVVEQEPAAVVALGAKRLVLRLNGSRSIHADAPLASRIRGQPRVQRPLPTAMAASAMNVARLLLEETKRTRWSRFVVVTASLLTDRTVRCDGQRVTRLVAVPRRCRVLDQPDVVRKDIPRHRSSRVLVAGVLVVDAKRHARTNRHIVERNLISIGRNCLQRHAGEAAPARVDVRRANTTDARLRRRRKIGSLCRGSEEHDADARRARWPWRCRCLIARVACDACRNGEHAHHPSHATSIRER